MKTITTTVASSTPSITTPEQIKNAIVTLGIVFGAIKDAGPLGIPSGHVYAALSANGMDLPTYESLLNLLKNTGLVRQGQYQQLFAIDAK